jgi:4-hydroxybenzoate polyprenyltransferase
MLDKLKSYLEQVPATPLSWLLGVSSVFVIRFFLESISSPASHGLFASDSSTLVHYYVFYLAGLLMLLVFFSWAFNEWKKVVPQLTALLSPALLLPPVADWLSSKGGGAKIVYLFDGPLELLQRFLSFGGGTLSVGLRVEIWTVLMVLGAMVYLIRKSWKKAIIAPILIYFIVMIFVSVPSITSLVGQSTNLVKVAPLEFFEQSISKSLTVSNNLHGSLQYSTRVRLLEVAFNYMMGKIFLLLGIAFGLWWLYLNHNNKLRAIIGNLRPERIGHYLLTILLGAFIAFTLFRSIRLNWNDWLSVIVLCVAFLFSWVFAVCVNDIEDEKIDRISNSERPLITGALSKENMKQVGGISLIVSLLAGFLAGYTAFFFTVAFTALYYIYSAPPTKFKLVPLFSSFLISLCYLSAMMAGFFLLSPIKQVDAFPDKLITAVVLIITLLSQVKDLKDVKGDKAAGVFTTAVLLGDTWAPRVIGVFAALSFLLIPIFSGVYAFLISAIPAGAASYYFINRKPYSEKPIIWTYFFFVVATVFIVLF